MSSSQFSNLHQQVLYIYVSLFTIGGLTAAIGNLLSLIISFRISPKRLYNKILISLSISDLLVGVICFPLLTMEILNADNRLSNTIETTRVFFTVFLQGASSWNLVAIAFYRYKLITEPAKDYKFAVYALLMFGWLFPVLVASSRFANQALFLVTAVINSMVPFFILVISYFLIKKVVCRQAIVMQQHADKQVHLTNMTLSDQQKESAGKMYTNRLDKTVRLLLIVYFCTVFPGILWVALDKINENYTFLNDTTALQHLYMVNNLAVSLNSSINPYIYFRKVREFQSQFQKMFSAISSRADKST